MSDASSDQLKLHNGSRIAVIGGGPAGSFFSYFLLDLAERIDLSIQVDIFEPQDYSGCGPPCCNHCGGIVSESLVQTLATEGINIPPDVVQRGIDSYILHMDVGSVRIDTPVEEKRIAAMFRGSGPRGAIDVKSSSFDGFLLNLAVSKGAKVIRERVIDLQYNSAFPQITTKSGESFKYDLVAGAVGVNTTALKLFKDLKFGHVPPGTTKTYICEFLLGEDLVQEYFGNSMHLFLLKMPRLQFAAMIPKGNYVTLVILGNDIDKEFVHTFVNSPEVLRCFPDDFDPGTDFPCMCFPKINIRIATRPFSDRLVLIGDCAVSRLYKDGIGAAYSTARKAASTAILHGISSGDFKKHYLPNAKTINFDNNVGKIIFFVTRLIQKYKFTKRGIFRAVLKEQGKPAKSQRLSSILWDTFTGSAPYRMIFIRTLNPLFLTSVLREVILGIFPFKKEYIKQNAMASRKLGKIYNDGETIIKEGEIGNEMFVIQSGKVEVIHDREGKSIVLAELGENDFFGEMAIFERELRSATIRAKGEACVLTVDKRTLLRKIKEDPSMAFRMLQKMSARIRATGESFSKNSIK